MNKNNWHGGLTIENAEGVGNMILEKLQGKKYCFITQNYGVQESNATKVRVGQYFVNGTNGTPFSFWYGENNEHAGFNFCDTYGVWCVSTHKHNRDMMYGWDSTYEAPYIVIDYSQVKIVQLNGYGEIICWVIAIQDVE